MTGIERHFAEQDLDERQRLVEELNQLNLRMQALHQQIDVLRRELYPPRMPWGWGGNFPSVSFNSAAGDFLVHKVNDCAVTS